MTRKPLTLSRRFNADGSITLLCRGVKVHRFFNGGLTALEAAENFAKGWYGDHPVIWGRSQFRNSKRAE